MIAESINLLNMFNRRCLRRRRSSFLNSLLRSVNVLFLVRGDRERDAKNSAFGLIVHKGLSSITVSEHALVMILIEMMMMMMTMTMTMTVTVTVTMTLTMAHLPVSCRALYFLS